MVNLIFYPRYKVWLFSSRAVQERFCNEILLNSYEMSLKLILFSICDFSRKVFLDIFEAKRLIGLFQSFHDRREIQNNLTGLMQAQAVLKENLNNSKSFGFVMTKKNDLLIIVRIMPCAV